MARFYENPMNQPDAPSAAPKMQPRNRQTRQDMERMVPRATPRPRREMPPGMEGQQYLAPGGMGGSRAGQSLRDAILPMLTAPSRVARGAMEGGIQAVNPDFQMPDYSNAQIPGVDFIRDMMRGGGQSNEMPLPRSFDPGTDALLRAYMRQMQGGK